MTPMAEASKLNTSHQHHCHGQNSMTAMAGASKLNTSHQHHCQHSITLLLSTKSHSSPTLFSKPLLYFHPLLASTPSNPEPLPTDQSWQSHEAQQAISEFLQGFRVSQVDSDSISSNSPRYLKMLVDGVRDLDELSLWGSCGAEGKDFAVARDAVVGFKKKVLYMAKEKGDNGKVAFLQGTRCNPFGP